jgi:epoxide hydrolase 4
MEHHQIDVGDVTLHVVTAGDPQGKPVMLLHGFPEFWGGWHHQIQYLAERGYHVIVPDQRGYNLSDKPAGIAAYSTTHLSDDIIGLARHFGYERISLVGHDWGGIVAWVVAMRQPALLDRLMILNVPHPLVMQKKLMSFNPGQLARSWYIFLFQLPALPEALLASKLTDGFARMVKASSKRATFTDEDMNALREAWGQPGAPTAMVNWYRAMLRSRQSRPEGERPSPRIQVPTRILWGERDIALKREMADLSLEYCDDGELFTFPKASHWLQRDEAEAVSAHIVEFTGGAAG